MVSNNKRKVEEEVESLATKKRLWLCDNTDYDDSSGELEEETEDDEVSSEESSMNQLDTSEDKLMAKCGCALFFGNHDDISSLELEPRSLETLSSRVRSDPMAAATTTSGCR
jgi:hypothetical protein